MSRFRFSTLATSCLVAFGMLNAALAQGETHEVMLLIEEVEGRPSPEFFFEPVGLYIQPGDTVRFVGTTAHHTVTAYHEAYGKPHRVTEDVAPFSSPVISLGESWEYTFDTPGIYDLWCASHEVFGMVMRIVVGDARGLRLEPGDPEMGTAGLVLADLAMNPLNIIALGAVSWTELEPESKALPIFLRGIEMPEEEQ